MLVAAAVGGMVTASYDTKHMQIELEPYVKDKICNLYI